jgi:hypothetical protein
MPFTINARKENKEIFFVDGKMTQMKNIKYLAI